jgi:hypothetical protein
MAQARIPENRVPSHSFVHGSEAVVQHPRFLRLRMAAALTSDVAMGPALTEGMGGDEVFRRLNDWGQAVAQRALQQQQELDFVRAALGSTIEQAQVALQAMHNEFRVAAQVLHDQTAYNGAGQLAALEQVVSAARQRFDELDGRLGHTVSEVEAKWATIERWAAGEPARVATVLAGAAGPSAPKPKAGYFDITPEASPRLGAAAPPNMMRVPPLDLGSSSGGGPPPFDAWAGAAARAATRASVGPYPPVGATPVRPTGPAAFSIASPADARGGAFHPPSGAGGGTYPPGVMRDLRIDNRAWNNNKPLEAGAGLEAFLVWKDRALSYLSRDRPDVRRMLAWAEVQSREGLGAGSAAQADALGMHDLEAVNYTLFDGVKAIISDSLLGRARGCDERGLELWRGLCAEWHGSAPQYKHAKARRFQDPPRCRDVQGLWAALPVWERLGEEVRTAGLELPDWMKSAALEKLVPTELLPTLISRPELDTYVRRLQWIKAQMEHARGANQALAYSGSQKDKTGDVLMGELGADGFSSAGSCSGSRSLVGSMQDERSRCELAGDWDRSSALSFAIQSLTKGKGNGKGKGKSGYGDAGGGYGGGGYSGAEPAGKNGYLGGKGGGGKSGDGQHAAGGDFSGVCNHCGIWGHRKNQCKRLDVEMAARRDGKGGGKGKNGKGKGIFECGDDDYEVGQEELPEPPTDELQEDGWYFDSICQLRGNRFAALAEDDVEESWPPPAAAPAREQWHTVQRKAAGARKPRRWVKAPLCLLVGDSFVPQPAVERMIGAVGVDGKKFRTVEAVVDSGAVDSVVPPGFFTSPVTPSPMSRGGRTYRAANGSRIENLGQQRVDFTTAEGHKCGIALQVAQVEHPLISVAHLAAAGNTVELGAEGGRIVNKTTGREISLLRRGGVYILQMRVPQASPFARPGA